jgi:Generalcontrol nonderepressible 1 (Gcn1) N-terminal
VKSEGILNATIAVSPKISFLLNERIYTKLTLERDQLCAINALEAAALRGLNEMGTVWSLATIYFICNPSLSRKVRAAAGTMLECTLRTASPGTREKYADIVVLGLEEWLRQVHCFKLSD